MRVHRLARRHYVETGTLVTSKLRYASLQHCSSYAHPTELTAWCGHPMRVCSMSASSGTHAAAVEVASRLRSSSRYHHPASESPAELQEQMLAVGCPYTPELRKMRMRPPRLRARSPRHDEPSSGDSRSSSASTASTRMLCNGGVVERRF